MIIKKKSFGSMTSHLNKYEYNVLVEKYDGN